jgi:hypothetical protein
MPHSQRAVLPHSLSRRAYLQGMAGFVAGPLLSGRAFADDKKPIRVAAVITEMTYRSHAHVILENFLEPYYFNGQVTESGCQVVSMYCDQFPEKGDLARETAKAYDIKLCPTIREALTLGGKDLAVDAVLSIGEHGKYPTNKKGQHEYPRKRFFDDIVKVFQQTGQVVPLFNDKHLSYRWDWAKEMYDTARTMKIPFMAGSSVPLAQRLPAVEVPAGAKIEEAIATHGGGLDSYDFHGIEVLQSMVEARAGGETGVVSVKYLNHEALWQAAAAKEWSPELLLNGLLAEPDYPEPKPTLETLKKHAEWGLLLRYRDGMRGLVVKTPQSGTRWHFACKLAGQAQPLATSFFVGPWDNRCLFKALSHAIQEHFRQKQVPYPVERTLLTTGIVAAGVESHYQGDIVYPTPHLNVQYKARDFRPLREHGASWKIVNHKTPAPRGMDRLGKRSRKVIIPD